MRTRSSVMALSGAALLCACHPAPSRHHDHFGGFSFPPVFTSSDDRRLTVKTPLDCPEHEGDLTRVAQAQDGASCQYTAEGGGLVDLRILPLGGAGPRAALARVVTEIDALIPIKGGGPAATVDAGSGGSGDHAKIDLPGIHIDAAGNRADVDILGAHIRSDGDEADVTSNLPYKGTQIHAGPGGAVIQAGEVGKRAANLFYLRAGDAEAPGGWRAAGFEARGPVAGPLLVAEFRSKAKNQDAARDQMKRLIDLNLEVGGDSD